MKIFLNSVGCRLNQSEIERISNQFRMVGHDIVGEVEESDVVIINTCTVTSAAASDSRALTRQAYRKNPDAKIILTGCWSTLEEKRAQELPGVVRLIHNDEKDQLVHHILNLPLEKYELEPTVRHSVPGIRMRTRAFIKAQDGCDNQCTFCITTIARGPARSMPRERILGDIQSAVAGGTQEAVLTGVQLTAYGKDLSQNLDLKSLVESIFLYTDIPRLRLSSLEPWEVNEDFLSLWDNERLCRQIHLPLQSGSNRTLRRMGRPIHTQKYASIISKARHRIPSIAITTDIMVGFPGEMEEDFIESLDFIEKMDFAHAHVFTYSHRPGTPAARLPDQVHHNVSRQRSKRVRDMIKRSSSQYKMSFIDKKLLALWETATLLDEDTWEMRGMTGNYLRVRTLVNQNLWNKLTPIRIVEYENNELRAEVLTNVEG